MEDSEEFKWAQKVVIKRQMRNLMEQLQETGEEVAVLTVNLTDNTCTHFGSPNGEWFISEQKNLTTHFLNFCKVKSKNAVGKSASSTPQMSPLKELNSSLFRSPPFRSKAVSKPSIAAPVAVDDAESGTTTMRVTIPRHLALGATDQELAGLVGRLVASQMAGDEKKGGDSCTKFEELVNAVNLMKKTEGSKPGLKRTSTPASGPVSKRARQEEVTPAKSKSTPDSGRSTRENRGRKANHPEMEKRLEKWIHDRQRRGITLTMIEIQDMSKAEAAAMGIEGHKASAQWFYGFLRRSNIPNPCRTQIAPILPEVKFTGETRRNAHTATKKLAAIRFADLHGNRAAGREFNVPESSVRGWRRDKDNIQEMPKYKKANRRSKPAHPKLETRLVEWVHDRQRQGIYPSMQKIREKSKTEAIAMGIESHMASSSWCYRFIRRFNISVGRRKRIAQKLPEDNLTGKSLRNAHTATKKLAAIRFAELHGNRAAGREFNVPESSVRDWRREKDNIQEMPKYKKANRRGKPAHPKLETRLVEWVHDRQRQGINPSMHEIREKSKTEATAMGIDSHMASDSWGYRFIRRFNISVGRRKRIAQKLPEDNLTGKSLRSGRKVSARFLEGVNSLKKAVRGEKQQTDDTISDEGTNEEEEEEEDLQDEKAIMNQISNMEPGAIKRVQVSTSDGKNVDVQSTSLTNLESLESIVAPIIQELDATGSGKSLCDEKQIKIVVCTEDDGDDDKVKIEMETSTKKMPPIKSEDVEESEDEEAALKEELDNYYGIEDSEYTDPDYDPSSQNTSIVETRSTPRGARQASLNSRRSITPMGLIRKIKKRASTETMPVQCESCGITVTGKSNLKSHFRRVHLQIRDHKCAICGKGFWSNNARESHMLSVHTRRCEACQEYVVESVPWGKGIDMKTNRDVICTCGAIVSIYSTFGRRRVYLRDDEPDDDGNIRQSRNKSNSGTKYACGTCGKLFMKKSNCERHSRAHTDAKDCVCYICGNSYTYESSLKKHLHNEHGIVKFACSLCGGNYSNEVALKVHMVKAHQSMTVGEHVAVVQQDKGAKVEDMDPDDEEGELRELEELDEEDDEGEDIPEGEGVAIQVGTAEVEAENQVHVQVENHIQAQNHGQVQVDNQMQVSEVVLGEAGHVQIASTGQRLPTTQEQIIQQVIQEGGGMSIIIKQVSVDQGLS